MDNFEGKHVKLNEIDSSVIIFLEPVNPDIQFLSNCVDDEKNMNGKMFVIHTDNYYYCDNHGEWYILQHSYAISDKYARDKCINRTVLCISCSCCFWNPCYYFAWFFTENFMNIGGEYDEEIYTYVKTTDAKTSVMSQIKYILEQNEQRKRWKRKIVI